MFISRETMRIDCVKSLIWRQALAPKVEPCKNAINVCERKNKMWSLGCSNEIRRDFRDVAISMEDKKASVFLVKKF